MEVEGEGHLACAIDCSLGTHACQYGEGFVHIEESTKQDTNEGKVRCQSVVIAAHTNVSKDAVCMNGHS